MPAFPMRHRISLCCMNDRDHIERRNVLGRPQVMLRVTDLDKSIKYYTEALGES